MAKWYGKIGYEKTKETEPGIWEQEIEERSHYGDLIRASRKLQGNVINGDVNISNEISIIADPFATQNIGNIKYVEIMGTKWKVSSVDIQFPRLMLSVGGLYHGVEDESTE